MKLVWVRGNKLLSKFIMWGLKEPVSHFAIIFDNKIVFHSDLLGVRIMWLPTFLESHEIVFQMDFANATLEDQEGVYQSIVTKFDGKPYDYKAFIYFGWRGLLWRLFKKPFPAKNAWNTGGYLCTEMAEVLPDSIVPKEIKEKDISMMSPYRLWLEMHGINP
jgi:hypothetical protein